MYSDDDLDAAVKRGDITAEGAAALRRSAASRPEAPAQAPDAAALEGERLRLVSGFHDVSVAAAALLTLLACWAFLGLRAGSVTASVAAAAAAWGLAEHFTRVRRLALTSVVLMLFFVAAAGWTALGLAGTGGAARAGLPLPLAQDPGSWGLSALTAVAAASVLHWMRFRVPAAMGMAAFTAASLVLGGLLLHVPGVAPFAAPLTFAAGLAVFASAMRWDLSDPARRTFRSDVAFWLHLAAAPMIVGPVFAAVGAHRGVPSTGTAAAAIGLYLALSAVSLAVDRRALMASALFYFLAAVARLLASEGPFTNTVALTGVVVGPALLLLSAFWGSARRVVLAALPGWLTRRLPPVPATA